MNPPLAIQSLIDIALLAGREIMSVYENDFATRHKGDLSPVTAADEIAEQVILKHLAELDPLTPVIAEEAAAAGRIPTVGRQFYLVDPLDGTKEFISRNGEFTVNIARVVDGVAQAGVVFAPAKGRIFWGECGAGAGAGHVDGLSVTDRVPAHVRNCPTSGAVVIASRSHRDAETDKFLASLQGAKILTAGSSLKFCLVATGEADIYPRFGRTMEWDTAAGHAVLAAAGGKVVTCEGEPLTYGKKDRGFDNPSFIASA